MSLLQLYLTFAKFGILCFGGGYMLVPLLTAELVGDGKPLSPQEFSNLVSIAQATPGPIGINTATYVGFTQHGSVGSILATLGITTPALILVILAIKLLKQFEPSLPVQAFLTGMKPASFGLILSAMVIFAELSIFSTDIPWLQIWHLLTGSVAEFNGFHVRISALIIAVATTIILQKTRFPFIYLLLISAGIGALICR